MATKIPYCDETWNVTVGCTKCSPGCLNCWAEDLHTQRHKAYTAGKKLPKQYAKPFSEIQLFTERLNKPLHWRKPRRILTCSMSDLFHPKVPFEFVKQVWDIGVKCPQHTLLFLTKRIKRALEFTQWMAGHDDISIAAWPRNMFPGVSICTQAEADEKIPILLQIPAAKRWLSIEPLLGEIDLENLKPSSKTTLNALDGWQRNYVSRAKREQRNASKYVKGIDWVVIGCESGPKKRPCKLEWIRSIVAQCKAAGVLVYVKQIPLPKIISLRNFVSDIPISIKHRPFIERGKVYKAIVNKHGAISAITKNGLLGLKPDEFRKIGNWVSHDPDEFPEDLRVQELL